MNITHLLQQNVMHHPEQIAIVSDTEKISYAKLWDNVMLLAVEITALSLPPQCSLVIYGKKSIATISAMLACLHIGQIYIPIQETQPTERLRFLCDENNVHICLFDTDHDLKFLQSTNKVKCIAIPELLGLHTFKNVKLSPVKIDEDEDAHAFTLYTSGSTGYPKGVKFSQRNVMHFLSWARTTFQIDVNDKVASFAPLHFDLSTFDLFGTLIAGAIIYLIPESYKLFPSTLTDWLKIHKITVIYMVPTAIIGLMKRGDWKLNYTSSLRLILFAGEPFPLADLQQLRMLYPSIRIANLYGPTETNVCTWYEVPSLKVLQKLTYVPIGHAIQGLDVYAVNFQGKVLTELESEGELYCVGPSVSLGYVTSNDNFFTTEKYRGYKTGDIVQLTEHGYVFLHRNDRQIKRQGYRIDLCEIESCLRRHILVNEAAVIFQNDMLIAYLTKITNDIEEEQLRQELHQLCQQFLPLFMHPQLFVFLKETPKTTSGKINYQEIYNCRISQDT